MEGGGKGEDGGWREEGGWRMEEGGKGWRERGGEDGGREEERMEGEGRGKDGGWRKEGRGRMEGEEWQRKEGWDVPEKFNFERDEIPVNKLPTHEVIELRCGMQLLKAMISHLSTSAVQESNCV